VKDLHIHLPRFRVRLAILLAILGCMVAVWVTRPHLGPPFTRQQYDRISLGMFRPEVERLLGCPSGYYADLQIPLRPLTSRSSSDWHLPYDGPSEVWLSQGGAIIVSFGQGRVRKKEWYATQVAVNDKAIDRPKQP
jgi:hypothetical protein